MHVKNVQLALGCGEAAVRTLSACVAVCMQVLRADLAKYAKHANAKQRLLADYRAQFDEWRVFMG